MTTLWQDLRYALRMLAKSPGFTAVAVLTLALGIGANTAIFSVVDAVLLKPLPFHQPDRLVALFETESAEGNFPLTGADYLDWQSQNSTFEGMSILSGPRSYNASGAGQPEAASVMEVQANFFSLLGVGPQLGRTFATGEDAKGHNRVVLLSNAFWKAHFGGRPDAVDKTVVLNSETYTVIGVMPAWFRVPGAGDVWIPIDMSPEALGPRGSHYAQAIGRIKQGVTLAQARADLRAIAGRLEKQFPGNNRNVSAVVVPMKEQLTGTSQTQLWTMFGAVGLVLLIACANVANLLLARSSSRRREIALRAALGAGRLRLVRQLLTESVLLSLFGGILGVLLAYNGVDLLAAAKDFPIATPNPVRLNLTVLLFTLGVSVGVGALFGLAPVIHVSGINFGEELKSKGIAGGAGSGRGRLLRDALVVAEIALSLALLTGAGLLLRTFVNLRSAALGVRIDHVLVSRVLLPEKQYGTLDKTWHFYSTLLGRLENSPGIEAAAVSSAVPLNGGGNGYITIDGQQTEVMTGPLVEWNYVSPAYFRAFGIPLKQGREFTPAEMETTLQVNQHLGEVYKADPKHYDDEAKKAEIPAIINEAMAGRYWPKGDAIGQVFRNGCAFRIIGVVGNTKAQGLRSGPLFEAYFPLPFQLDAYGAAFAVVVRTAGPPDLAANIVRGLVKSLDDSLAVFNVRTMPQIVAASMTDTSYETVLLASLAALALILAAVGTYGVMSYAVEQRTNEIGIRMALGAQQGDVLRMVLRQGLILAAAGIAAGIFATAGAARLIRNLLYGVAPSDPLTYLSVAALLAAVALLACYIPARRAMRVDPMVALRYE